MKRELQFSPHAGRRLKKYRIPKDVAKTIATYGQPVRTERIGNWITQVFRGQYKSRPVHIVVQRGWLIKTGYFADEWECNVRFHVKRHPGVKVI
jgi:hypothetical protein